MMSLLLVASPTKVWAGAKVGIITDLKGSVTINGKNAELLQEVETASILAGKAGSKLTVSFKDGHTESISGDFKVQVTDKALKNLKGNKITKINPIKKRTDCIAAIPITSSKPAALTLRGNKILPLSPLSIHTEKEICSKIDTVTPTFRFSPESLPLDNINYVIIRNTRDFRDKRVIEITNKDRNIITVEYPEDLSPLEHCKEYIWAVSDTDREKVGTEKPRKFTVLSAETIEKLKTQEELAEKLVKKNPDDLSPYVSLVSLYFSNEVFSKAIEYAKLIEKKRPDDNNIKTLINFIYTQLNYNETDKAKLKKLL